MHSKVILFYILLSGWFGISSCRNEIKPSGKVKSAAFDKTIAALLTFEIPVLSVQEARKIQTAIYLDAREPEEFKISHIPLAKYIGCDHWLPETLQSIAKEDTLIVYCSVGYRSEKIGIKIKALGYTHVFNLYGSIFEWVNEGYPLEDEESRPATKLHTYNKEWSSWVTNPVIQKTW